ncbi:hypothetical protein ASF98_22605 [Arthrobacter sp. Leaf337]|uniref:hypothetical protein n=1 Tax=Arthrobacter sp. Leaf337 TaxID=1736342 RepID=UPI0006F49FAC|nr:hypothetical protein [Arthrobacter sp. Leaf337]KQR73200.1 hypothetical protein ASF98_22605 [Arthrobacter sp. Leaf337]
MSVNSGIQGVDWARNFAEIFKHVRDSLDTYVPAYDRPWPDIKYAQDILQMWHELIAAEVVQTDLATLSPRNELTTRWLDEGTLISATQMAETLLAEHHGEDRLELTVDGFEQTIRRLRSSLQAVLEAARLPGASPLDGGERSQLLEHVDYVFQALRSRDHQRQARYLDQSQAAAAQSEAAAMAASTAAGKTGEDAMSAFYAKLGEDESARADTFRKLTVGFALAAGTFALIFVLLPGGIFPVFDTSANDYVGLIQKTVFVAGIFGIAGYFARQAHQHRSMANWAGSLAVQLQTFEAFLAAVDNPEVRDELRKSFATRAFGEHPAMKGEPAVAPSAAAMETAVGLAAKLTGGK